MGLVPHVNATFFLVVALSNTLLYKEAFGYNSCCHFVPHLQKLAILPKSHMGDSVEVHGYGYQADGLHM
jgi:hypothetical protein